MDSVIYPIAGTLFLLTPLILIIGLIRPRVFRKLTGKTSRKRIALFATILLVVSVAGITIFEPDSVKQERLANQQQVTEQENTQTEEQEKAEPEPAPILAVPEITSLKAANGSCTVSGRGNPGEPMELQTGGEKYKVLANDQGDFTSEPMEDCLPYGSIGLYTLEKSFIWTKAVEQQIKYYSLFASKPKLSNDKLPAHITEAKQDGKGFKVQGFYLASTDLELIFGGQTIQRAKTNKDGFFVFTGVGSKADTMAFAIRSGSTTVLQKQYVYTPKLRLINVEPEVKTVSTTEPIPFQSTSQDDGGLTKGVTRISTAGKNGVRTLTYKLTYIDGKEVKRDLVSNEVTTQPVNELKKVGTYEAPAPVASDGGSGSGYTNSSGNYVPSPSSNPVGASAKCRDGTYSYSQSRRGTCSHHGGVAVWY